MEKLKEVGEKKEWKWKIPQGITEMPEGTRVNGRVWKWARQVMSVATEIQGQMDQMRAADKAKVIDRRVENRHALFMQGREQKEVARKSDE